MFYYVFKKSLVIYVRGVYIEWQKIGCAGDDMTSEEIGSFYGNHPHESLNK